MKVSDKKARLKYNQRRYWKPLTKKRPWKLRFKFRATTFYDVGAKLFAERILAEIKAKKYEHGSTTN